MSHPKYSDLPFEVGSEEVIVVQPEHTLGMSYECFLGKGEKFFQEVFNDVITFQRLQAIGMLRCYMYGDDIGRPSHFESWKEYLTMEPISRQAPDWLRGQGDTLVSCKHQYGRNTNLVMPYWFASMDIADIMFHLMMKQMVPQLHTCNWVDCSRWKRDLMLDQHLTEDEARRIQGLGFMSIVSQCFWGDIGGCEKFLNLDRYSLGFVLMPGMDMRAGCGGFDEWLRFLVAQKYKRDVEHHKSQLTHIAGPRPRQRS